MSQGHDNPDDCCHCDVCADGHTTPRRDLRECPARRGNAKRERLDLAAAIADYTLAISLSPNAALAYYNRAWAHYLAGESAEALADANRAIEIDDHSASAFSTRGLIREKMGDTDGAIADFRQALKLDPKFQQPAEGLKRLQAGAPKSQ